MKKKSKKNEVFICGGRKYHLDSSSTITVTKETGLKNPLNLKLDVKFPEQFYKNVLFSYEDIKVPKGSTTDKELSKLSNYLVIEKQNLDAIESITINRGEFTIQENDKGVLFVTLQFEMPGRKMQRGKMQNGIIK